MLERFAFDEAVGGFGDVRFGITAVGFGIAVGPYGKSRLLRAERQRQKSECEEKEDSHGNILPGALRPGEEMNIGFGFF